MFNVLIADDEKEIIELLSLYLDMEGYKIYTAYDGLEALQILKKENIDIAIIDIMMPKLDGYHLIKKIRENYILPVIILSAKNEYSNKILGLELGADDYVTKPFNCIEVVTRVKAHLRRFANFNELKFKEKSQTDIIKIGDIELNTISCRVCKNNKDIVLTSTEYKILLLLIKNPGRVFTKKQIFEHIWEENFYSDDNAVMVHISNLRNKLEKDSKTCKYIKTIRGLGYKFEYKNNL